MSDLDNMSEATNDTTLPVEAVEANAEESQVTPQTSDTETELFFAEDEGDQNQPKTNMTQEQSYAAFRKEQDKRKRKNEQLEEANATNKRIQDELDELKAFKAKQEKGPKPTLADCDYDEDQFQTKLDNWYSQPQPQPKHESKPQPQNQHNDQAEFYHYQKAEELKSKLPDFDEQTNKAREAFTQYGGNPDIVVNQLSMIAQQTGTDIAKALYAFGRTPSLVSELNQACATGNQFAIAEVVKKAAGKIKTRERKPLDTDPTPSINSSGAITNQEVAIKKAMEQYAETGSTSDYLKLVAARKKKVS